MSSAPIIQVDCASCGTNYRLALPKVLVDRPHRSMSFRCNHCSYKFQIQPKDILDQDAVASTLILVESNGFHVHQNLESVADLIENGTYAAEDTIRVFGQPWSMMGDEPSLSSLFRGGDEANQHSDSKNVSDAVDGDLSDTSEVSKDAHVESGKIDDLSLDFDDDDDDDTIRHEDDSEQDFSEIDPFSEGYSAAVEEDQNDQNNDVLFNEDVLNEVVEESLDADFFADTFAKEQEGSEEQEGPDDFDDLVIEDVDLDENVFANSESEDLVDENTVEATADVDQAIIDGFTEDVTQVVSGLDDEAEVYTSILNSNEDVEEFDEEMKEAALFSEFEDDGFEDIDDEFAVQAIEANLWDELEDSEDDVPPMAKSPQPVDSVKEKEPQNRIQSTKSALLADPKSPTSIRQPSTDGSVGIQDNTMIPEMEVDEDSAEFPESDPDTDASESKNVKPKQRLSFSNKVPEVNKVKKREINGLHAFAFIVLFCIILIAYTGWKVNPENPEFTGIETNSNILTPMVEEKDGLQENDNEDGQAPDADNDQEGVEPGSLDAELDDDATQSIEEGEFVDLYPQVLPDVPEESFDFANDKSSRELTREGYRALREGKPDQAIKLFELALEKDGTFAEAVLGLGKSHQKRGELEQAKEAYCRHANLPPESFSPSTMVEDVNISQGIVSQLGLTCDDA